MVSSDALNLMVVSVVLAIMVPFALLLYFYKRLAISLKAVFAGVVVWLIFSQVLEKILHVYVLQMNAWTATWMDANPIIYALYASLASGIFEEGGRWLAFSYWVTRRAWKDGLAYGIGHGGIESILIGVFSLQNIFFAKLINNGQLDSLINKIPLEVLAEIKNTLVNSPLLWFAETGIERMIALVIQIALSILVMYGVIRGRKIILAYAVLAHAAVNFPAAFYQARHYNIRVLLAYLAAAGVLALLYILWTRIWFKKRENAWIEESDS